MLDHRALLVQATIRHNDTAPTYAMLRDYRDGRHRLDFASEGFRKSFGWALRSAQENLCPIVIAAYTDMLGIESWGDEAADKLAAEQGLDRLAALVHDEVHLSGDAFAIVWGAEPRAVFHRADQVIPIVDEERPDRLAAAVKFWLDAEGYGRAAIYDDMQLTRWRTKNKVSWTPRTAHGLTNPLSYPTDAEMWGGYERPGMPQVEAHTFGCTPVVWWKRDTPSQYEAGRSVLMPVIPVQDELNKAIADAIVSSERIARPMRYVLQVDKAQLQPHLNPKTGLMEPPEAPVKDGDSLLAMTAAGPAGQFPGPDASAIISLQEHAEAKIARVTGIPPYMLHHDQSGAPSGESLRVQTSRLLSAARAFQRDSGPAWRGLAQLLGITDPHIVWSDPLPLSTAERLADAAAAKALGLPAEEWLRIGGWDPAATDEAKVALIDRLVDTSVDTADTDPLPSESAGFVIG